MKGENNAGYASNMGLHASRTLRSPDFRFPIRGSHRRGEGGASGCSLEPPSIFETRREGRGPSDKKKKLRGALVSVASDSVTVEVQNLPIAIPRSEIRRLKVESESQRSKNAAIGAGIGAGGGIAAAIILDGALTDGNGVSGSTAVLLGGLGSAAGFVIRIMRRAYKTIYE